MHDVNHMKAFLGLHIYDYQHLWADLIRRLFKIPLNHRLHWRSGHWLWGTKVPGNKDCYFQLATNTVFSFTTPLTLSLLPWNNLQSAVMRWIGPVMIMKKRMKNEEWSAVDWFSACDERICFWCDSDLLGPVWWNVIRLKLSRLLKHLTLSHTGCSILPTDHLNDQLYFQTSLGNTFTHSLPSEGLVEGADKVFKHTRFSTHIQ